MRRSVSSSELLKSKKVAPSRKKSRWFGEEQREARQVDLTLIHFGLGEIGVDREDRTEERRRVVEEVNAGVTVAIERTLAAAGRGLRSEEAVGLDVEAEPLRDVADAGDVPGVGHAPQALVARPPHPDRVFVLAPHRALEVHAPGVAVGVEVQRAERDFDFERPPDVAAPGAGVPDAVPLAIVADRAEQRVGHEAGGIHLEEITRACVEEGVDRPHEPIVRGQPLIASPLIPEPPIRFRVEGGDAEVEPVAVVGDADFGRFGGGASVVGVYLNEIGRRDGALPDRLVEDTIECDAFFRRHPSRGNRAPVAVAVRRCGLLSLGSRDTERK